MSNTVIELQWKAFIEKFPCPATEDKLRAHIMRLQAPLTIKDSIETFILTIDTFVEQNVQEHLPIVFEHLLEQLCKDLAYIMKNLVIARFQALGGESGIFEEAYRWEPTDRGSLIERVGDMLEAAELRGTASRREDAKAPLRRPISYGRLLRLLVGRLDAELAAGYIESAY